MREKLSQETGLSMRVIQVPVVAKNIFNFLEFFEKFGDLELKSGFKIVEVKNDV